VLDAKPPTTADATVKSSIGKITNRVVKPSRKAKSAWRNKIPNGKYRLLQEWKDKVKDGLLGYLLISHYGVAQLKQIQKDKILISMTVDFNYNQRTFLPTPEPPDLLTPSDLLQINPSVASAAMDQYAKCEQRVATMKNASAFVIIMNYKGIVSMMPNLMMDVTKIKVQNGGTWNDIVQHLFGTIKLQSSVFDSWVPLQLQNIKQQLNLIRQSPDYQPFLVNALNILTTKPQHKTHIVMVQMNMGLGLGQIDKLIDYQVWTVDKVKKEMRKSGIEQTMHAARFKEYEAMLDNREHHPQLLASRQTHPNNVMLPVFFIGKPVMQISPELLEIHPGTHEIISQKASATRTRQHFAALLTNITFATVTSPELH
jgi:hypothetical protein